ncbi:hypothetical protein EK21DRAFT_24786, partial [Setomelanomma holmii]
PTQKQVETMAWMLKNANTERIVLRTTTDSIQQSANPVTSKGQTEVLDSYSLAPTEDPLIYAPGYPPLFNEQKARNIPPEGLRLQPDEGKHWADRHGNFTHQFEAVFQMLALLYPSMRFNKVEIVINRTSLMYLHKISKENSTQSFHLDLELVGNTLFIGRRVKNAKTTSNAFGHNFEEAFTIHDPDSHGANGYFRVIKYQLGDLEVVVRLEADAYKADNRRHVTVAPATPEELKNAAPRIPHGVPTCTKVVAAGAFVPQNHIIELKSNDSSKPKEQM